MPNDNYHSNSIVQSSNKTPKLEWMLSPHLPIEVRVYETKGSGMDWHVDDVLYDPPQLEMVYTLENKSDCSTAWKTLDGKEHRVETEPNSAILLLAGGAPHKVTPLSYGRRVILKVVYVQDGAAYLGGDDNIHKRQFGKSKTKTKQQRRRKA
jgi:hypothetical protein